MFGSNESIRRYTCFVCGSVHDEYQEMQEHIKEKHEQGREYLICPVKYCSKCIRDMRSHFRSSHPALQIPKNCQMRPTVLYDFSSKTKRKIPTFKEGYIISEKNHGKTMHYRSNYEKEVYESLEVLGEVIRYDVEPFPIEYHFRGKQRNYFPDLIVEFIDGSKEIWEVKPANQQGLPMNKAKWKSAEHYCRIRGWKFEVINETKIAQLKKKTKN